MCRFFFGIQSWLHVPQTSQGCASRQFILSGWRCKWSGQEQTIPSGALWQMCEQSTLWSQRSSEQRKPSSEPSTQSFLPSHRYSTFKHFVPLSQVRFGCSQSKVFVIGAIVVVVCIFVESQSFSSDPSTQSTWPSHWNFFGMQTPFWQLQKKSI